MDLPRRAIPSVAGLLAFEATARYLSFSRAAEDLCLSQGAVSKRVRQLEQVVGVPLLARTRHQVYLTDMGRTYLGQVRQLLEDLEATTQALRSGARHRDAIVVAAPLSFSLRWLMPRLRRYRETHPDVRIDVVTACGDTSLAPQSGIDCLVHSGRVQDQDILSRPLFDLHWVAVASPTYRDRHKAADIADAARVVRIEQMDAPGLWAAWMAQTGASLPDTGAPRVEGLELAIAAAIAGHGIALAPHPLIDNELRTHDLAVLFEGCTLVEKGYQLAIPARLAGDPALSAFAHWVECEAGKPMHNMRAA